MRKFTATDVASEGSEELVQKVAAHMTHGEDTARKYYRHIQGVAESVNAYSEMTSVSSRKRKAEEDEKEEGVPKFTPKLKQCIKWLPEEDKEVNRYHPRSAIHVARCTGPLTVWHLVGSMIGCRSLSLANRLNVRPTEPALVRESSSQVPLAVAIGSVRRR